MEKPRRLMQTKLRGVLLLITPFSTAYTPTELRIAAERQESVWPIVSCRLPPSEPLSLSCTFTNFRGFLTLEPWHKPSSSTQLIEQLRSD